MTRFIQKIKLIYLPFLGMAVSFVIIYTFLNWLLLIKLQAFSINEDMVNIWMPFVLPWIPVLLWLRPRIKLLRLTGGNGNLPFLYQFAAALAIAIPSIVAQNYIGKAAGELNRLNNITELNRNKKTRYYMLKHCYLDKKHIGIYPHVNISGKHNEDYNMAIHIAIPILDNAADTLHNACLAWLGKEYSERISNRYPDDEKRKLFETFAKKSIDDFDNKDFSQFIYLDRLGNSDDRDAFIESAKRNSKYGAYTAPVLLPVNEPFAQRTGNSLAWIFGSFGIGAAIWLIIVAIPKSDLEQLDLFEKGSIDTGSSIREFILSMKPKEGFFFTPIIISLNAFVFLAMVFSGLGFLSFKTKDLLHWGANFRPYTTHGEWWRLLTSVFLHGGIIHIGANMIGLLYIGVLLEPVLGKRRYLSAYLLTGVLASCASICWYPATISVGASGAVFGMYGLFLALLLTKVFPPDIGKAFLMSTLAFIGFNLLMGLTGAIDNAAHIGGLLSGFVLGIIFSPALIRKAQVEHPAD